MATPSAPSCAWPQGRVTSSTFSVVGVLQAKGGTASNSSDDRIFVPLPVVQKQIAAARGARNASLVSQITVQTG